MFCLVLPSNDPFFNLAVEEYLLRNKKEEYLILGINSPSVIIGKHQSPHREINTLFVTENNIPVIRRISGGGAVFHDAGNLNFTFIKECEPGRQVDFRKYTKPVIDFLSSNGVEAKFEGKNDLKVDGLKISGNAEHVHRNRLLHHGTLLFSTAMELLRNSLRKDTSGYKSRSVGSNPSPVMNLEGLLPAFRDISEFRNGMKSYLMEYLPVDEEYILQEQEIREISLLADSKYRSWEWNWAYGPEYQFTNEFDYLGNNVSCRLFVREGTIRDCILEGNTELEGIAAKLTGCRHMFEDLTIAFNEENISDIGIFNFF